MTWLTRARPLSVLFLLAWLAAPGCGRKPEERVTAQAFGFGQIHWTSFPIPLQASAELLEDRAQRKDLRAAIRFWEQKAGRPLFSLGEPWRGGAPYHGEPTNPEAIDANVIFFQTPWTFDGEIAGEAVLLERGSVIQKGMILLDPGTTFCMGTCASEPGGVSFRKLLAHELGHLLGMGHSEDPANIMYPRISSGGSLKPMAVDEGLLRELVK